MAIKCKFCDMDSANPLHSENFWINANGSVVCESCGRLAGKIKQKDIDEGKQEVLRYLK